MKKLFLPLLGFLLLKACGGAEPPAVAQSFVAVTAASIYNGSQPLLPSGTIQFQAVNAQGVAIPYQVGGGGQQLNYPTVCAVVNGAIVGGCQVANTAATNPLNVCFSVTVKNSTNQVVLGGTPNGGYQCAQPAVTNYWCTAGVCNFDAFVPNIAGIPIVTLPLPSTLSRGGIYAGDCTVGQVVFGYAATGHPDCVPGGTGGSAVWGGITGVLANQPDLAAALALLAPLANAALSGVPTAPTPSLVDSSIKIATTAYVQGQNYAGLNGPAFSAPPTAPDPPTVDSTQKLVTAHWVSLQGFGTATGNVSGPVSSVVGNCALFNATNGKAITDCGFGFPLDKSHLGTLAAGSNGLAVSATTDTTNAVNINSGLLPAARLPLPTATTLGGVESFTPVTNQFLTGVNTSGVHSAAQPTCGNLSNSSPSCSTDTTNASNISSGTLPATRLPNPSTTTLGGIESIPSLAHTWIDAISNLGVPHQLQPACVDLSNSSPSCSVDATNASNLSSGTLSNSRIGTLVAGSNGLANSATTDATNAGNINAGTLNNARLSATITSNTSGNAATATALAIGPTLCSSGQAAQGVLASGNATGCTAVGGSTLTVNGGSAITAPNFINGTGTTVNQSTSNITFNLNPASASIIGGVKSIVAASHKFLTDVDTAGLPHNGQPACGDLSDGQPSCSVDTTNASNISSGTIGAARLPNPSSTTLGGIQSISTLSHTWIDSISTLGVPHQLQPAASDVSGLAASATTDTTNASNITAGTLAATRVTNPLNQSTTGNAATATALAAAPMLCSAGNAPTGILANGNSTGCAAIVAVPGGSSGQFQTNSSGNFAGVTFSGNMTSTSGGVTTVAAVTLPGPTTGALTSETAGGNILASLFTDIAGLGSYGGANGLQSGTVSSNGPGGSLIGGSQGLAQAPITNGSGFHQAESIPCGFYHVTPNAAGKGFWESFLIATGPTATGTLTATGVTGTTSFSAGSATSSVGYAHTPPLVFSGGGGSGATGVWTVSGSYPNFIPTGVTVTSPGTGYTSGPTAAIPCSGAGEDSLQPVTDVVEMITTPVVGGFAKWSVTTAPSGENYVTNSVAGESGAGFLPKQNIDLQNGNGLASETPIADATYGALNLACITATQTVGTCPSAASNQNYIGVLQLKNGSLPVYVSEGQTLINSNGSASFTQNDIVCADITTAGKVADNGTALCMQPQVQVGRVVTSDSSVGSHLVNLQRGPSVPFSIVVPISGASIATTTICTTAQCPVGVYKLSLYIEIITPCGVSGTYSTSYSYTDDAGSKNATAFPFAGTGVSSNILTITSAGDYAQGSVVLRTSGVNPVQYATTAVACGSGSMSGNMYLTMERLQWQ